MKVSELAKELKTTSDEILETLKALKLKAKGSSQELSTAVASVIKSEYKKTKKATVVKKVAVRKVKADSKKEEKKPVKETKVSETVKPKKKAVKKVKVESKEAKDVKKKTAPKKRIVKKVAKRTKTKTDGTAEPKTDQKDNNAIPKKSRSGISSEPLITLKPLARKRKKSKKDSSQDVGSSQEESRTGGFSSNDSSFSTGNVDTIIEPEINEADLKEIEIKVPISVKDFATKIQQKPSVILSELMKMGIFAHINQGLNAEIINKLTRMYGFALAKIRTQEEQLVEDHEREEEDASLLTARAPVITFMGHVDHGKTSLLDSVRKSKIADREHGGITQHMGAYSVNINKGSITFLDTPGHEAFTAMRARGAHITDIVVLVIAADEGIMPQTEEAIDHARAANVPIVVALNKIDKPNIDIDRVKKQLAERNLASEDWGGKTVVAGVSAKTGAGVDELLELILLEAELLELKANSDKKASGIVVEAHLSQGKGAVTTLIVQSGTLKVNDIIVAGAYYGKIKALHNDRGGIIKEAGPSMPVEMLGLSHVPDAGEKFYVVDDEKQAREITFRRQEQLKSDRLGLSSAISLEDLYSQIQEGAIKEVNVVLKADVQGSLEALKDSLGKIPSDKVKIKFIHAGVGEVNASDVLLAFASKAIIIAFHVDVGARAKKELEKEPVDVRQYKIIYDAVNDMKNALEGMLDAKINKKFQSRVEIREVFKLTKSGKVAGCYVTKGKVTRKASADIIRDSEVIYTGKISTLKRFKDDVREVTEGMECGISIDGFDGYQSGDIIEVYEIESIAQKL